MEIQSLDVFLSDKFIEFSKSIESVHARKKALTQEFKKQYDAFHVKKNELDDEAKKLVAGFEAWKIEIQTATGDS